MKQYKIVDVDTKEFIEYDEIDVNVIAWCYTHYIEMDHLIQPEVFEGEDVWIECDMTSYELLTEKFNAFKLGLSTMKVWYSI